jgi:hypothetical protein
MNWGTAQLNCCSEVSLVVAVRMSSRAVVIENSDWVHLVAYPHSCWQEASLGSLLGLNGCPHDLVPKFPSANNLRESAEATVSFMTEFLKISNATSTIFFFLKPDTKLAYTQGQRNWTLLLKGIKECVNIVSNLH